MTTEGDMTLGELAEALAYEPWGCACSGPYPVCACARFWAEARALQRAAHIAIKMIADVSNRLAGS